MADDLGYGDLGSYGQTRIRTPRIDRLAAEGVRFVQAYAGSTVCAPSRSSLMTGLHNGHNRVRDNIPHEIFLTPDDVTVAEVLKQAGYRTGAVGKWSLGDPGSWGIPNYQGFDYFFGQLNQDQAQVYFPDYLWENEKLVLLFGNRGGKTDEYTEDHFVEKALQFIRDNRDHPFFLYLPFTLPHYSDYPDNRFMVPSDAPYGKEDWPRDARNYAAMITRVDTDVGRIVDLVKDLGLDQNTLILFTSDNGPFLGSPIPVEFFDSNGPLRGGKRDMYEGGIRVPLIARWPGTVGEGRVSSQVVAFWDVLPTLAELAGLRAPQGIDGISFVPTLIGEPQQDHDYLYWDYGHTRATYTQAVRWGDWKGVRPGRGLPLELYDLSTDLGEDHDVAASHPDVVAHIESLMKDAFVPSEDYLSGGPT